MNENEIRDLLGAGIGEEPPITGGPAAVFAGARSHVVRTRAVTGALSMVAVLGIAAGAVALGGGSGKSGRVVAGLSPTSVASTPSPAASTTPGPTPAVTTPPPNTTTPTPLSQLDGSGAAIHRVPAPQPGAGQVLIDGHSTAEIAKLLLPSGLVTSGYGGQDSYQPTHLGVETIGFMSLDDGTGKPTVLTVHLVQNSPRVQRVTDCTTEQELNPGRISDCRAAAKPDGSVVVSYRLHGQGGTDAVPGAYSNEVIRVFQDGSAFAIGASNYYGWPSQPPSHGSATGPSRKDPLLSIDQLAAMVMDPRWGLTVPAEIAQQAKQSLVPYRDNTPH